MIDEPEDNLKKYLNVSAIQQDTDWRKVNTDDFNIEKRFDMHRCRQEDFGTDEKSIQFFESWSGYMIMCPEFVNSEGDELKFSGAKGMTKTRSVTFRVERCSGASHCESEPEIDNYISDISVQTWIIQEQINFQDMYNRPTSKKMDMIDVQTAPFAVKKDHRNLIYHTMSNLQHNTYKTEDSWIWIGDTTRQGNFYTFSKILK